MKWVKRISIAFGIAAMAGAVLVISGSSYDKVYEKRQAQDYHVFSIDVPKQMNFAGEDVPLNQYDVRERLDRELHVNAYWQSSTLLMIKRANRFFPRISPILKKYNVPDDFKYLALAESGFQDVVSPSGAEGYWQFISETGKRYGLEIDNEVDERYNIDSATAAACRYFLESYKKFNSWTMVAASYNMGYDGLQKVADKQKARSYYDIELNQQTARYVFRILAIKEIMEHPSKYGFNYLKKHLYYPIPTERKIVDKATPDLVDWAIANGINYKILKEFNPWLKTYTLNNAGKKTYSIEVPKDKNIIPANYDADTNEISVALPERLMEKSGYRPDSVNGIKNR